MRSHPENAKHLPERLLTAELDVGVQGRGVVRVDENRLLFLMLSFHRFPQPNNAVDVVLYFRVRRYASDMANVRVN